MLAFSKNIVPLLEEQLGHLLTCNILPANAYLAGGTAVYFYLRHRLSVDLDFFTQNDFNAEIEMDQIIMLEADNSEQRNLARKEWEEMKTFFLDLVK